MDTSALYAAISPRDANHVVAIAILHRLSSEMPQLLTSNYVVAEAHALTLRLEGRVIALQFLTDVEAGSFVLVRAVSADEKAARDILKHYEDKDFSLTDAISFAIMERLGISQAFSFDSDFAQYGFEILTP